MKKFALSLLFAASLLTVGPVFGSMVQAAGDGGTIYTSGAPALIVPLISNEAAKEDRWFKLPVKCDPDESSMDKVLADKQRLFAGAEVTLLTERNAQLFQSYLVARFGDAAKVPEPFSMAYIVHDKTTRKALVAWVKPNNCVRYASYVPLLSAESVLKEVLGPGI